MHNAQRFNFVEGFDTFGVPDALPQLPLSLTYRGLLVSAQISNFAPVQLVFAWSLSDDAPLLLGRMNFFLEFDVCFYRSQLAFEVRPKA